METTVSEVRIDMPARTETCRICLDDNINADQMFSVDICRHRFCSECLKRHIEVQLLQAGLMICPHDGCKSKLVYGSCVHLLTPTLQQNWAQRIKENSIPVTKRVYCPNPRCSALMSVTSEEAGVRRCCFKCGEPFCTNCKVPWHNNLSCDDYMKLYPNGTEDDSKLKALAEKNMWRQCGTCQNMIELSQGCASVICRCGHTFCYRCGAINGSCSHGHNIYDLRTGRLLFRPWCFSLWLFIIFLVIAAITVGVIVYFVREAMGY